MNAKLQMRQNLKYLHKFNYLKKISKLTIDKTKKDRDYNYRKIFSNWRK